MLFIFLSFSLMSTLLGIVYSTTKKIMQGAIILCGGIDLNVMVKFHQIHVLKFFYFCYKQKVCVHTHTHTHTHTTIQNYLVTFKNFISHSKCVILKETS